MNMSNTATGRNSLFEIVVDRWSKATERAALIKAFDDRGSDGVLALLERSPRTGFARPRASLFETWRRRSSSPVRMAAVTSS
ncbi:MAG: hypothetical protein ACRD2I_17770 [Vicinamibacterales bacterium]